LRTRALGTRLKRFKSVWCKVKKPSQRPEVVNPQSRRQYLGLTPGTVSAVLLGPQPSARSIPPETKKPQFNAAAKELNYRPNFFARTLRNKRTYTIGVIAEEIGDSYSSPIISGIEQFLRGAADGPANIGDALQSCGLDGDGRRGAGASARLCRREDAQRLVLTAVANID